jgi:hypothetical protein
MANIWSFEHDSAMGVPSQERANIEALNALSHWTIQDPRRRFVIVNLGDTDGVLVAELRTDNDDSRAGSDLDEACATFRVRRAQVLAGSRLRQVH